MVCYQQGYHVQLGQNHRCTEPHTLQFIDLPNPEANPVKTEPNVYANVQDNAIIYSTHQGVGLIRTNIHTSNKRRTILCLIKDIAVFRIQCKLHQREGSTVQCAVQLDFIHPLLQGDYSSLPAGCKEASLASLLLAGRLDQPPAGHLGSGGFWVFQQSVLSVLSVSSCLGLLSVLSVLGFQSVLSVLSVFGVLSVLGVLSFLSDQSVLIVLSCLSFMSVLSFLSDIIIMSVLGVLGV